MTGRGRAPAPHAFCFIFEHFLVKLFPIQTWRGQDLNDGQGQAPATLRFFLFKFFSYSNLAEPGFE